MSDPFAVLTVVSGLLSWSVAILVPLHRRYASATVHCALCVVEGSVPGFPSQWTTGTAVISRGVLTSQAHRPLLRRGRGVAVVDLRPVDVGNTGDPPQGGGRPWEPFAVVVELQVPGWVLDWAVSAWHVPEPELRRLAGGARDPI